MNLLRSTRHRANSVRSWLYLKWLRRVPGVRIGDVILDGMPIISVRFGGRLEIDDNVKLRSRNAGYHLNMFAPVKLFADNSGATIKIGTNTRINGSCVHAVSGVEIGRDCLIAANCQIIDSNGHELSFPDVENRRNTKDKGKAITIDDSVWIGTGAIVMPGVRIGRGSIIGASSVVTSDVPPMCLAAGNPAQVIREFKPGADDSQPHRIHK